MSAATLQQVRDAARLVAMAERRVNEQNKITQASHAMLDALDAAKREFYGALDAHRLAKGRDEKIETRVAELLNEHGVDDETDQITNGGAP